MDYLAINKNSWNKRAETHIDSDFYDVAGFLKGNTSLNELEMPFLGDLAGKELLHLQCHFGQDTLSLARLGAHVTGVDLSDKAIELAHDLAGKAKIEAEFICSDVYSLPTCLQKQFDVVFTSYGTIGWLPDLDKWASVVSHFLKPQGKFILVEFHPVVWMFDYDFQQVKYNYFNDGAIVEDDSSYTDKETTEKHGFVSWNHSISEVINSLLRNGLTLDSFDEFDYSPYNVFNGSIEVAPKRYQIAHFGNKIPMVYALTASKKA